MVQASFHFPRGFLWGTATSAYQVEGENRNNSWWTWEQEPGHIHNNEKSGAACDWWNGRWREDFDRAAETHQNAHRLSIDWGRIQPEPDRWDESALDRYRDMLRGLYNHSITPMVTLHHFSDPIWLAELGGWENPAVVDYFTRFVKKTVEALQEYANLWVTINEPNVFSASGYLFGIFPPGKTNMKAAFISMENLARAHAAAYHAIHQIQPTARVGIAAQYRGFVPNKSWSPLDKFAAGLQSRLFNDFFPQALSSGVLHYPAWSKRIPGIKGTQDFLGVNYYTQDQVRFNLFKAGEMFGERFYPPNAELSETGFIANTPPGMFDALKWAQRFQLPILVTENGIDDSQDVIRPRYLVEHLHQIWRAVNFNFPVKGYFYWTLVDNFEWERGWSQRFGLWELDAETQIRRKRPSADLYAEICQENGITSELVARYAPELLERLFPG